MAQDNNENNNKISWAIRGGIGFLGVGSLIAAAIKFQDIRYLEMAWGVIDSGLSKLSGSFSSFWKSPYTITAFSSAVGPAASFIFNSFGTMPAQKQYEKESREKNLETDQVRNKKIRMIAECENSYREIIHIVANFRADSSLLRQEKYVRMAGLAEKILATLSKVYADQADPLLEEMKNSCHYYYSLASFHLGLYSQATESLLDLQVSQSENVELFTKKHQLQFIIAMKKGDYSESLKIFSNFQGNIPLDIMICWLFAQAKCETQENSRRKIYQIIENHLQEEPDLVNSSEMMSYELYKIFAEVYLELDRYGNAIVMAEKACKSILKCPQFFLEQLDILELEKIAYTKFRAQTPEIQKQPKETTSISGSKTLPTPEETQFQVERGLKIVEDKISRLNYEMKILENKRQLKYDRNSAWLFYSSRSSVDQPEIHNDNNNSNVFS